MLTINGIDELRTYEGKEIGVSGWKTIDQPSIDAFAEATGDHQFIHVDPARARETPFGGTIVHGYFTLSLAPRLAAEIYDLANVEMRINYGANRIRFPAPLIVGSRMRMRATLASVDDVPGGFQLTLACVFEVDGGEKPVCVADILSRVIGRATTD
jgi:acyl dehydratase